MRLNNYISSTGLCSRREADKLIEQGRVTVNGKKAQVYEKYTKVSLDGKTAVQLWRRIYPVQVACKSGWCSSSWISVLSPYP